MTREQFRQLVDSQILVLDGGHIVQRGTHAELAKQDGIYSRFISQREQAESWHISGQKA